VDPTVEFHQEPEEESPRTRIDLPRRQADPTREDLPERPSAVAQAPRRRSPWRWVRRVVYLVVLIIVGIPLGAGFYVWWVAREDVRTHSDAILVLGAAQYNGKPGDVLAWRLQHALNLYHDGVAKHIMTVGGNQPGDEFTEAGSGKAWLNQHGVPNAGLVAVRTGNDTLQSMIAAGREFRKLGWHTAVIVTDPPHSLRSRTMARANGINAVTSPTRSGPTVYSRDTQLHYIVRETGGYLYFQLIGRWRDEP